MKSFFKYISFFLLLLNGYGAIHANNLKEHNDFITEGEGISFQKKLDLDYGFDYFDDSDALIHEKSRSNPDTKFSETEEVEIEEAQNESDTDASKKYLEGSNFVTTLFYAIISAYHDYNRSDNTPNLSNQNHTSSYPSICVRYCVFRI
ncbi:hypothetical protein [Zunongwangia pacifica]|uniref:Uncharacterized protein n=1 Tax=Zunongwangia pacifica TaxID=2911062 RepID=A0A9X1ZM14_9FLAO|nr:hypothetical protein [Zunongwangia pacifica]MCL6217197.1 hypothetical protein [Zunongwangia pacifica]